MKLSSLLGAFLAFLFSFSNTWALPTQTSDSAQFFTALAGIDVESTAPSNLPIIGDFKIIGNALGNASGSKSYVSPPHLDGTVFEGQAAAATIAKTYLVGGIGPNPRPASFSTANVSGDTGGVGGSAQARLFYDWFITAEPDNPYYDVDSPGPFQIPVLIRVDGNAVVSASGTGQASAYSSVTFGEGKITDATTGEYEVTPVGDTGYIEKVIADVDYLDPLGEASYGELWTVFVELDKNYMFFVETIAWTGLKTWEAGSAEATAFADPVVTFDQATFDIMMGDNTFPLDEVFYQVQSVSAVPIPPAIWLFGSGLLGLVGIARRKKAA